MSGGKKCAVFGAFVGRCPTIGHEAIFALGPSSVDDVAVGSPVKYLEDIGGGGHEVNPELVRGQWYYYVGFRRRNG